MSDCYIVNASLDFFPETSENVMTSIFKQYEKVIIESIITSFGLDFLIEDHYGGDVDTIHNVRQIGKDEKMAFKNQVNHKMYNNNGEYNSHTYHNNKLYIEKNREISQNKKLGILIDSYTNKKILPNEKTDLDHVISAKEIHSDAGRVLAGLNGTDLANSPENLQPTNPHTNRTKKADSMDKFLEKYGDEYNDEQKTNMKQKDTVAREKYESKLAKAYYTSPKFAKDVAIAAGNVSIKMGTRQALGFVFAEMWFSIKEEFEIANLRYDFDLSKLLYSITNGIKKGFENAKLKYTQLFAKFQEGVFAGLLSSLTTTLCNIFFTTAKNVVKIIRQSYVSIVQAAKILFINPDNLLFGERIHAATKFIATGASIVIGSVVSETIGKTPIAEIPVIGDIVQTFCGTLVTGVMSCTLLFFLDRSKIINKLVNTLNNFQSVSSDVNYFYQQAIYFEEYAAKLMNIDIESFKKEVDIYSSIVNEIENTKTAVELNTVLKNALNELNIKILWEKDFDTFMNDKNSHLVFE